MDPFNISKEDLDNRRKEITSYYEENIPHLKVQKEYEELLRDIEKTRAERLQAQMFIAQTMATPPEDGEKFCGLPVDEDSENEKTAERVENWCAQLKTEMGI